ERPSPCPPRAAARGAKTRRELARGRAQLARRHARAERRQHEARDQRDDREHDEELEQRYAARPRSRSGNDGSMHRDSYCALVMSLFAPSPPSLPSAPYERMSYGPLWPGALYLYSLPQGSLGSVDFFQYGPFQLATPGGALMSACRPSC